MNTCCPGNPPCRPVRHRFAIGITLAVSLVTCARGVRAEPGRATLSATLRDVVSHLPHAETTVGACVVDLVTGDDVFAVGADAPLVPASTMKVFVMVAALRHLGADFAFETVLATNGEDLFLIGGGDPALGDAKLAGADGESITTVFERWADALIDAGVTTVPGDIIVDESIFDDVATHPSWERRDLNKWYAAPVGALNFNDNCVDLTVSPAGVRNAPAVVTVQPESSLIRIDNACRSGGAGTPLLHHVYDTYTYRITGRCTKRWPFGPVSFPDPGLLAADSMRSAFAARGVHIAGSVRRERVRRPDGTLPSTVKVVARDTTPLVDVLARIGKDSQNLFAECLMKRLGYAWAKRRGQPDPRGSWALGAEAIAATLSDAGIDAANFLAVDGSGLSRDNRCTARQLAGTLAWMYHMPEGGVLRDSLAIAGVDGSLRKRLRDVPDCVYAKTGTMRGVRVLAGFAGPRGDPRYAFAVMFNGYPGPSTPYKRLQDRFCRALIDYTR